MHRQAPPSISHRIAPENGSTVHRVRRAPLRHRSRRTSIAIRAVRRRRGYPCRGRSRPRTSHRRRGFRTPGRSGSFDGSRSTARDWDRRLSAVHASSSHGRARQNDVSDRSARDTRRRTCDRRQASARLPPARSRCRSSCRGRS